MKITKYESPVSPFDALFERTRWGMPLIDRFFPEVAGDETWSAVRLPRTNLRETEDAFVYTMEMPGLSKDNIEVNIEGDMLIVKGERSEKKEEKGLICQEYHSTRFERSFNVGSGIDRDKVKARMEDGILTVTLPKTPEKIGRKIEIA